MGGRDDGCADWRKKTGSCYPGRGNSMTKAWGSESTGPVAFRNMIMGLESHW